MDFSPPPTPRPLLAPQVNARAISAQPELVQLFAKHFVTNGFNAMKAAVATGFVNPSPTFVRNLADSKAVKAAIGDLLHGANLDLHVSPDTVKRELARVAFGDVRGLFHSDGTLKNIADLDDDTAAGVSAVEVEVKRTRTTPAEGSDEPLAEQTETRLVKIKRYDKLAALNILARHTKLVGDEAQDGINALAGALASRLDAAKRRMSTGPVEDVEPLPPRPVIQSEPQDDDLY